MQKTLHIVVGATAVGKTSFAIRLAQNLETEIVSADSRQIFKEMCIGVARPSAEELASVKHHLISAWSINESYNAARYEHEAMRCIDKLFEHFDNVVLCGGSGMYINAVINGLDDIPDTPSLLRNSLSEELESRGLDFFLQELRKKDPNYYAIVDKNNPRRVMRAIEVIRMTGKPYSSFRKGKNKQRDFRIKLIGLQRDKEDLWNRIDKRTNIMVKDGLIDEVRSLIPYKHLPALSTVGYREIFDYFDGKYTLDEAVELIKTHTRQYAKRQMTWFRKIQGIQWFNISTEDINISQL